MQVSLWVKESKNGNKYFSASFKEPYVKNNQVMTKPDSFSDFRIDSHDDLF